jgi:hypothetical protein
MQQKNEREMRALLEKENKDGKIMFLNYLFIFVILETKCSSQMASARNLSEKVKEQLYFQSFDTVIMSLAQELQKSLKATCDEPVCFGIYFICYK